MITKKVSRSSPDPDLARWCAALVPTITDKVPPGWLTANELADKLGKSRDTISSQMTRAVRAGRAEMQRFRIVTGRGTYPVPHYRLK